MNIPSDYLAKVAHGKNADQTADDARIIMPPLLVPAFDVPRPAGVFSLTDVSAADGRVINDSCVYTTYAYHQNQVAQDDNAFFLLAGLWVIELQYTVQWDFAAAPALLAFIGNLDVMDQAGTRNNLLSAFSNSAARGLFQIEKSYRFHVKPRPDLSVVQGDVWSFFFQFPATNVAATNQIQMQLSMNIQRYL